jgi:ABC-2 type transport system ATP-binding protein
VLTGYDVQGDADGRLRVHGCTTDQVGHLAHVNGVELHELAASDNDLERLFLEMTGDGEVA